MNSGLQDVNESLQIVVATDDQVLLEHFASRRMSYPVSSPFEKKLILLQEDAMLGTLTRLLADHATSGIAANLLFRTTERLAFDLFRELLAQEEDPSGSLPLTWLGSELTFLLVQMIEEAMEQQEEAFSSVMEWVTDLRSLDIEDFPESQPPFGGVVNRRLLALGYRLVGLFQKLDRYRSLNESTASLQLENAPWLEVLYHRLVDRLGPPPFARLLSDRKGLRRAVYRLLGREEREDADKSADAKRESKATARPLISMVGVSRLARSEWLLLRELSTFAKVEVAWSSVFPDEWVKRFSLPSPREPHALLLRMAQVEQEVLQLAGDLFGEGGLEVVRLPSSGENQPPKCLLEALQADLRGEETSEFHFETGDTSIQFHACYGDLRQVELVKTLLLGLLEEDPTLTPRDIVLVAPELDTLLPMINRLFRHSDSRADGEPRIAVGRFPKGGGESGSLGEALLLLFDMAIDRISLTDLLSLLSNHVIYTAFGIDSSHVVRVRSWLEKSGFRYEGATSTGGLDWALMRLTAGVMALDDEVLLLDRCVPVDDMEGQEVLLLGNVLAAIGWIREVIGKMRERGGLVSWGNLLVGILDRLSGDAVDGGEDHRVIRHLRENLELFQGPRYWGEGSWDFVAQMRYDAGAMKELLRLWLEGGGSLDSSHLLSVGVASFDEALCQPYRVVVMLGMNEGAIPRTGLQIGFDPLLVQSKVGDASRRTIDMLNVLRGCRAAREHLIITWEGFNSTTNEPLQAALPVRILGDFLGKWDRDETSVVKLITTSHPLQPFGVKSFSMERERRFVPYGFGPHLAARYQRARIVEQRQQAYEGLWGVDPGELLTTERRFALHGSLNNGGVDDLYSRMSSGELLYAPLELSIDDLVDALCFPLRVFSEKRLSVKHRWKNVALDDLSFVKVGARQRRDNSRRLQEVNFGRNSLRGADENKRSALRVASRGENERLEHYLKESGMVSDSGLGRAEVQTYVEIIDEVRKELSGEALRESCLLPPVVIDLVVDGVRVRGVLERVYELEYGFLIQQLNMVGSQGGKSDLTNKVRLWIEMLLLQEVLRRQNRKGYEEVWGQFVAVTAYPRKKYPKWVALSFLTLSSGGDLDWLVRQARLAYECPLPFDLILAWNYLSALFAVREVEKNNVHNSSRVEVDVGVQEEERNEPGASSWSLLPKLLREASYEALEERYSTNYLEAIMQVVKEWEDDVRSQVDSYTRDFYPNHNPMLVGSGGATGSEVWNPLFHVLTLFLVPLHTSIGKQKQVTT